ncbi:DNA repair protein RAD5A [Rutidosis leptorrhynchoides]|uniref:DNA repair protein RAD5A n=1 Tax=Rutidosis leptorrhynchoides TaxID=125765 RepID=UPI003A991C60
MGNKVTDELITTVQSIVGHDYSKMEVIRALHMANNDATAAINIIFDTPSFKRSEPPKSPKVSTIKRSEPPKSPKVSNSNSSVKSQVSVPNSKPKSISMTLDDEPSTSRPIECKIEKENDVVNGELNGSSKWWFVGCSEVIATSTCKGMKIRSGDHVNFMFPSEKRLGGRLLGRGGGRGRQLVACSEIVRFSTSASGEIGRIPNEWSRCLLPLVRDKKIQIEGFCKSAPVNLGLMDTINLCVSVYINSSILHKSHKTSLKVPTSSNDETSIHPLPTLFRLLGLIPFKKAEFTPDDLYTKKRPLDVKDGSGVSARLITASKNKNSSSNESAVENEATISDNDLDHIVGVANGSDLEEMEPPSALLCDLRPYQKQALHWMVRLEKGPSIDDDAATTLHPCWDAYHLADERKFIVYVNAFSGEATVEFPSTLQMSRGGILADAMGLGKTIMTISLLVAHTEKGGSFDKDSTSQASSESNEAGNGSDQSLSSPKKVAKFSGFDKLRKQKQSLIGGGNLIICPMTLIGQWKAEIESHVEPGSLSIYVHYGQSRPKDAKILAQSDVVLTTYGVVASEFSSENVEERGGLYSVRWFRVVLDEAHTIKSSKSQISMAAATLVADCRWCLTGTPIQNNLEDIYSLIRFLRIEPWGSWAWWNKLIQKPFEDGDARGLSLVQNILKPIMLRRTKFSTDKEGRPILVLPPAEMQVIYCEQTEVEKDFYDALFKRSKVKFDQFIEQGRVLHNYASILELLLRLRQCCDHPFLVMSRGDTQEFSDLGKLAKRFLKGGGKNAIDESKETPSKAYIQEVVKELQKGEQGECPICLEAFEDAVLTPCAHRLCRECLLSSWKTPNSGICPVCRKSVSKQELITAPTDSRFRVDVDKNWTESSKVSALLRELENFRSSGSKSIVFSQWTAFLDLLQIPFSRNNISFVRLDGTLNQQQREKVIKQFSEERDIMVLLMSLKAGGVGINLTAASNAFVMDPWWNPAVEEQAVMRIHRIGQTKSVHIKRFIVKGTVEERMVAVQARKQRMISGALTDQEVRTARIEELKMLFT